MHEDVQFNKKSFNPQAFGAYYDTVPKTRLNALLKADIFRSDANVRKTFANQTGSKYAKIPLFGRLNGKPVNYDGVTKYDDGKTTDTYTYGAVVFGRKDKFYEDDFSYDITSKVNFWGQIATQLSDYWDDANEDTLISILKGIFSSKGTGGKEFIDKHTLKIKTSELNETTLNEAMQKACGDKKSKFTLVIMNSLQATELENKKLLTYLTYNDTNGLEVKLNLAQWNGRLVMVDDEITYDADTTSYVMYVLGRGSIIRENLGVKLPHEVDRDPDNDRDVLYSRERLCIIPYGFSYLQKSQATDSPTDEELATGENWDLASNGNEGYFPHKEIPIAKIVLDATP